MPTPKLYENDAARQKAFRDRQKAAREQAIAQGAPKAAAIPQMPSNGRWTALIQQAKTALDTCRSEMQDYYDDRTEQWQEGEKAEEMQQRIERLENMVSDLEEL